MSGDAAKIQDAAADAVPSNRELRRVIGFRVRRLHALFGANWHKHFRDLGVGITPMQGGILLLLTENPGISHNVLARLMSIEPPTLVQTIAPLLEAGYVERYRSPRDGRAVALHLTRAGQDLTQRIRAELPLHEQEVLANLSEAERRQLLDLIDRALE